MAKETGFVGPITITRKGFGFFAVPGSEKRDRNSDLIIPPEWTNHALYGDTVRVAPAGMYRDTSGRMPPREAGKVIEIVTRARETFVGTLVQENGQMLLNPDYKKMHLPIEIRPSSSDSSGPLAAQLGFKALVQIKGWDDDANYPWGAIKEIIGKAGEHETEMRALVLGQGFATEFPPVVRTEAKRLETDGHRMIAEEITASFTKASEAKRRDFRNAPTFTIDPADAKDFDDALSLRANTDGTFEVGVHIADVSFFVQPDSILDHEARERATSVYLVDRTIPMLPEILSTDLCSLNPDEDRLAVSAVFTLNKDATVLNQWFGATIIHSDKRFTYEEAQGVLDTGKGAMHAELTALQSIAQKIRAKREAKGAIEFDTPEVKVELDKAGNPIAIHLKERKETNLLIEDFMLLANEAVAKHLATLTEHSGLHLASLYRIHDTPDPERIENLVHLLRVLGYDLKAPAGRVAGVELNRVLEKVKGTPEEYLIKTAVLRSMAKAIYATKNIGHFGLAFDYYTHFTSPIRRYPDLLIHRLVKAYAQGNAVTSHTVQEFDQIAAHASEREVAAADAERDSVKMKQVQFLAPRVGEIFDAVISGVSDRGLYVEEKETHADGMIRISDVGLSAQAGDDYFDYDEKNFRLVGRRTHAIFRLGDPIKVKLVAARIPERELDFVPAESKHS